MFVNTYNFEVENAEGKVIPVSLRLTIGAQMQLKKKYKETTTSTMFEAIDDVERFVDIIDAALKWKGNENEIKSGEELIELMAANDMLGMIAKQTLITSIGRASGIFSETEKEKIDAKAKKSIGGLLGDETDEKNA